MRWLPGLRTLRRYEISWLPHDIVAGLVLTTMLAPVGVAYAVASGVPGIYGLYATIVPLLAYAVFGPSRIMVLGPDSSLAALILGVVLPLSAETRSRGRPGRHDGRRVGDRLHLAGVARLGFVTELLSKPIRYGYMNGIALTVLISQLPKLFGFSIEADGPAARACGPSPRRSWAEERTGRRSRSAPARWLTILLLKTCKRAPGVLIAVVGATVIVGVVRPGGAPVFPSLAPFPTACPAFSIPWITYADVVPVLIGGCAVALVSFADTSVLSRAYAARTGVKSTPTRRWWGSAPPIWRPGSSRAFRSAAARRARPWRRPQAPEHN